MKVSILIPTLNRSRLLRESLESAQRQTYGNLEILVSDNGSTDDTRTLVEAVSRQDPRVRLLPLRPSSEMFTNFNYLVEQSRGDAFCILSDDDRLLPGFAEQLVAPLIAGGSVVASFCDHWLISATGERLNEATEHHSTAYGRLALRGGRVDDPIAVVLKQTMSVVFAMYRASALRDEPFDLSCGGAADVDYAIRVARAGDLFYVPARLAEYRVHAGTVTSTRTAFMLDGAIRAYTKHTFSDPAHEAMRLGKVRAAASASALFAATRDRKRWNDSVRLYRQSGGSLLQPALMLSYLFASLPPRTGEALRHGLKAIRSGFSRA